MITPQINKPYVFVRRKGEYIEGTVFTMHRDGSCGFNLECSEGGEDSFVEHTFEFHPDGWKSALQSLRDMNFVELQEAKHQGLVPPNWEPYPRLRRELERLESLLAPCDLSEWMNETGDIDAAALYRRLKAEGRKRQAIYRQLRILCGLSYREFVALAASTEN